MYAVCCCCFIVFCILCILFIYFYIYYFIESNKEQSYIYKRLEEIEKKSGRHVEKYMKNFIAKRVNFILVNLRYLRFKLLKYTENNKNIC